MKKIIVSLLMVLTSLSCFCDDTFVEMINISSDVTRSLEEGIPESVQFNFEFEITATGNDIHINKNGDDIRWKLYPYTVDKVEVVSILTSTADYGSECLNDCYVIQQGKSESFNFSISLTATEDVMAGLGIYKIGPVSPNSTDDWETEKTFLKANVVPEPRVAMQLIVGAIVIFIMFCIMNNPRDCHIPLN